VHVKQFAQGCYVVAHRPGANLRPSDHEADALPLSHHAFRQKNFENRLTFDEVNADYILKGLFFLTHPIYIHQLCFSFYWSVLF